LGLRLNNEEIRSLTVKIILVQIFVTALIAFDFHREVKILNAESIKQNVAIAGAVLQKYPELEEEIVANFTTGYSENYEYGKGILKKYSYDDELMISKNPLISGFYKGAIFKIILIIITGFILIYGIIIKDFTMIFKKIRAFSQAAEAVIEGDYDIHFHENREGEFYIFAHQFNMMVQRLKNSIEMLNKEKVFLKDSITDISHQLKTPISSLVMFNEILISDDNMSSHERTRFVQMSKEQLERMEWLTKNLLKMARLDAGVIEFNKEDIPISHTIDKALCGVEVKAKVKNQRIELRGIGQGLLKHDSEWTAEALSNIVKNAIEHTAVGGKIIIHWEETPLSIQIAIKDNGPGISKEELGKIFKRFYKGKNSTNPSSIGIGLSLARLIIESQNGSISVESEEGIGTEFNITFLKFDATHVASGKGDIHRFV
jgi:signal transduction histidine kinase